MSEGKPARGLPAATIRTQVELALRFPDGSCGVAHQNEIGRRGGRTADPSAGMTAVTGFHLSDANQRYLETKARRGRHTLDLRGALSGRMR